MIELYQKVLLNRNFPEYDLKKGDVAILVDTVPHPSGGEEGYILEVFNLFKYSNIESYIFLYNIKPYKSRQFSKIIKNGVNKNNFLRCS